jgi:hypothetical protein
MQTGITVRPGVQAYVSMEREFLHKLEDPYSDCLNDLNSPPNEYSKILFSYFVKMNVTEYDRRFCELICFQEKLIKKCNCSDISTPKLNNESYCVSDTELNCMLMLSSYFKIVNTYKYCGKACPAKCNSIKYILKQTSRAHFTNPNYMRKLQSFDTTRKLFPHYYYYDSITSYNGIVRNITDLQLMQNYDQGYLRLSINYDSLYRIEINEKATISSDDVYNFFGQQIGFYLDASILTMTEFPVFILLIIADIFIHLKYLWKSLVYKNTVDLLFSNYFCWFCFSKEKQIETIKVNIKRTKLYLYSYFLLFRIYLF